MNKENVALRAQLESYQKPQLERTPTSNKPLRLSLGNPKADSVGVPNKSVMRDITVQNENRCPATEVSLKESLG